MKKVKKEEVSKEKLKKAITEDFGLSVKEYFTDNSDYFVMPMSVLENMNIEDQRNFVAVVQNINSTFDMSALPDKYVVMARGKNKNSKGGTCSIRDPYRSKSPPKYRK